MSTQNEMRTVPYDLLKKESVITKINYWLKPDKRIKVRVYLKAEPDTEKIKFGLCIDGSASMKNNFGTGDKTQPPKKRDLSGNHVARFAKTFCPQLARLDYDQEIKVIYWATGRHGAEFEEIGALSAKEAEKEDHYKGPQDWGTGTQILPAILYFVERTYPDRRGFYLFISDGIIDDEERVTDYCRELAERIEGGQPEVKFFLAGVGRRINREQLKRLDDMRELQEDFPDVDLWDTEVVKNIDGLHDLFREWIEKVKDEIRYQSGGRIIDHEENVVLEDTDSLPSLLEFTLPPGARSFTLETNGTPIEQPLF